MTKTFIGILSLLLLVLQAQAANWYVRPGGTGSKTGADWNNAWDVGSIGWSSVKGGDTVWLAGGTYTSQVFPTSTGGSAGNLIYVKRVQATDAVPAAAAGWQSSFDSQVVIAPPSSSPVWQFATTGADFYYVDGRVDSGISLHNPNINTSSYYGAMGVGNPYSSAVVHDITLTNIDMAGPEGTAGINHISYDNAICLSQSYNVYVYNCRLHGGNENANFGGACYNVIFDHCKWYDSNGWGAGHANMIEVSSASNVTLRYCEWWNWGVEGFLCYNGSGSTIGPLYLYGNIFHDPVMYSQSISPSPRIFAFEAPTVAYFYNNTLVNMPYLLFYDSNPSPWTGACENNIFWNIGGPGGWGNMSPSLVDYNYSDVSLGETHGMTGTGASPFVNYAAGAAPAAGTNYAIVSTIAANYPRNEGLALAAIAGQTLNIDFSGNTRGADGAWDIGAFEYAAAGATTNPVILASPSSLSFGAVLPNSAVTNSFTVQNVGGGTLAGTATVPAPFAIVSGGAYSLGANQSQTVLVSFSPSTNANANSQTIACTGGGGTTVSVSGQLVAVMPGLSFSSYAGTVTSPMVTNSAGYISQSVDVSGEGQQGVTNGGSATYFFQITNAGQYVVNASVLAASASSKSFWVNIDSLPVDPTMICDVYPYSNSFQNVTISWRGSSTNVAADQYSPEIFNLSSGVHELYIIGREANVEIGRITIAPYGSAPLPPSDLRVAGP